MTSKVDILEGHNGPVDGSCSESSTCDPLLGQREGRDERIIASQHGWPRPSIIRESL